MEYLSVANWEKFQHYKDRCPPWIKLHRDILNDYEFACLQDASKLHLVLLWLLASQCDNKIPADAAYLKNTLHLNREPDLKCLVDQGFLIGSSGALAGCKQSALGETETETKAEETPSESLSSSKLDNATCRAIIEHLNAKAGRQFRPDAKANLKFVRARLEDGNTPEDLIAVIDRQTQMWAGTDQEQYLRPATLFNATKFEQYVGQLGQPIRRPGETNGRKPTLAERAAASRDLYHEGRGDGDHDFATVVVDDGGIRL